VEPARAVLVKKQSEASNKKEGTARRRRCIFTESSSRIFSVAAVAGLLENWNALKMKTGYLPLLVTTSKARHQFSDEAIRASRICLTARNFS
jgi:hypothetical protein